MFRETYKTTAGHPPILILTVLRARNNNERQPRCSAAETPSSRNGYAFVMQRICRGSEFWPKFAAKEPP